MTESVLICLCLAWAVTGAGAVLIVSISRWPLRAVGDGRRIGGPALALGLIAGASIVIGRLPGLLLAGAGGVLVLGLVDDRLDLQPWQKLLGQGVAVGLAAAALGPVRRVLFGVSIPTGPFAAVVPFLWILATTNAANLIDGLDGLAACVLAPSFAVLGALGVLGGDPHVALTSLAAAAALVGFYPLNRRPARLLLGDTGVELLGFLLGALTLHVLTRGEGTWSAGPALLLVAVPLSDTGFAVVRRLVHGRSILRGDRRHIHHRLAARLGEGRAVTLLSGIGVLCALAAALLSRAAP